MPAFNGTNNKASTIPRAALAVSVRPAPKGNVTLSDTDILRYARHLSVPEIGFEGQVELKAARVLIIGAGGIGSASAYYLAAAGIGTIGIVDSDQVELSNLQRQILHTPNRVGQNKTDSAAETLQAFNPDLKIELHPLRLTEKNASDIIAQYDIVADGSDNFETRLLLNRFCWHLHKPLVMASAIGWNAQLTTFKSNETPCYECAYGQPAQQQGQTCAEAGVVGAVTGTIGSLQAAEMIKEILGIGTLAGQLLQLNLRTMDMSRIQLTRDENCKFCGKDVLKKAS
jgi:adenylyltransferase/sulfurtransferase